MVMKKKSKKASPTRQTACHHCGYKHFVMHGGWVVNGNKQVLCYNEWRNCFDKVRDMRSESKEYGCSGFVLSLDD